MAKRSRHRLEDLEMRMSDQKKHLMLALSRQGFGEAILGLRVASELKKRGDDVHVLAHDSNAILLRNGLPHLLFASHACAFFKLYLDMCIAEFKPDSILLADYFTTALFFEQAKLSPAILKDLDIPIVAIDTWNSSRLPRPIDVFTNTQRPVALWEDNVVPIYPVPFLAPEEAAGVYQSLPEPVLLGRKSRQHLRSSLGVGEQEKAVLFCTAEWQHANYESVEAIRIARWLPALVADYVRRLGRDVHLIHVGPQAYDLKEMLQGKYHWLPPLPPTRFDALVASMDLLFSANISATTIAKAMVSQVPILVLHNSVSAQTPEEVIAAIPGPPSPFMKQWMKNTLPIFPFALWPLGYHKFLAPLLERNPYLDALDLAEVLDESLVQGRLSALLFDTSAREEQIHRQAAYLSAVRSLPNGPDVINGKPGAYNEIPEHSYH
jgi:hypothetical protein